MTLLDQALSQFADTDFQQIGEKVGLTPAQAETALAALGRAKLMPENTVGMAAAKTNLPVEKIQAVLDAIGGEDGLERIQGALAQGGGLEAARSGLFDKD